MNTRAKATIAGVDYVFIVVSKTVDTRQKKKRGTEQVVRVEAFGSLVRLSCGISTSTPAAYLRDRLSRTFHSENSS